jgi:sensor domain CHASE-containing protein
MSNIIKIAVFVILLSGLTVLTSIVFKDITFRSIKDFNRSLLEKEGKTVLNAFSLRGETIKQLNKDWSQWDDSYAFVQGQAPEFEQVNLVDQTLETANLNMILFFDKDGYLIYKKSGTLGGLGDTSIPSEVFNYTTSNNKIDIKGVISSGEQQSGFLSTTEGTFVFAVSPILTSEGQGPAMGALMMARYINKTDLDEIRKNTGFTIDFIDPRDLGNKFYPNISLQELEKGTVVKDEGSQYSVYMLTRDSWGNPATVINLTHPLQAMNYANTISQILTLVSVAFSAIFAGILLRILPGNCLCPVVRTKKQ